MYKKCSRCKELKLFSDFNKDKSKKDGLEVRCKICRKISALNYYEKNKELILESRKKYAEENKDKIMEYRRSKKEDRLLHGREYYRINRDDRKAYRERNRIKIKLQKRLYRATNRSKFNAKSAKRRAAKLKATPNWLTNLELQQIEELYEIVQAFKLYTGQEYHVDHIVPLQGENVCGLHVPWNLQILEASENLSKHNKLLED